MHIHFHNGSKYEFSNVSYERYHKLINAESIGRHFGAIFRGNEKHPCVKIE